MFRAGPGCRVARLAVPIVRVVCAAVRLVRAVGQVQGHRAITSVATHAANSEEVRGDGTCACRA